MSRLQKQPLALLAALRLKIDGQAPSQFVDALSPIYDATAHYRADTLRVALASAVLTAAGAGITVTVPAGEVWALRTVSMACLTMPAVAENSMRLQLLAPGFSSANGVALAEEVGPTFNDVHQVAITHSPPRDLILTSGWALQGINGRTLAVGQNFTLAVLYEQLETVV